jgi:hypothetical protein
MRLFQFTLVGLALTLGLAARNARAQSIQEFLTFAITAEYEFTTNTVETDTLTNSYSTHRTLLVGTHNIVKAIAVDLFGDQWTNWNAATLLRRVNPTNGEEGIFMRYGDRFTNVSSFFGTSYLNDFTYDVSNAFPGLTNNFTPQLPIFRGWVTNRDGTLSTNTISLGNVRYISMNSTNLKFNLIGVNISALSNGQVTNVTGTVDGVHYSTEVDTLLVNSVGSLYINMATNLFNGTPFQPYAGTARGTFGTGIPGFSRFEGPPGP